MAEPVVEYDATDDVARARHINDICDSLVEECVPPDVLAPIREYASWLVAMAALRAFVHVQPLPVVDGDPVANWPALNALANAAPTLLRLLDEGADA